MGKKRRAHAEGLAPAPTVDVVVGQPSNVIKDTSKLQEQVLSMKKSPSLPKKENSTPQKAEVTNTPSQPVIMQKSPSKSSKLDVDNFVPETDAIENFLEDQEPSTADRLAMMNVNDEDTDDDE